MQRIETIADLRHQRAQLAGTVGLVPTMGYLHAGHMSLVAAAREMCDKVIATIFVNPTQFAPDEDLAQYPRDLDRDLTMLREAGVDMVFFPTPDLMYPPRFQTWVTVDDVTSGREGGQRPTHFKGVTTIVNKLFNLTQPDSAFFGQKDAQQVVVIRRMVQDLNIPVDIQVCPIVREEDGLALSSRNVYLSDEERQSAQVLNQALMQAGQAYNNGERNPDTLRTIAIEKIKAQPHVELDYVSLATATTFEEVSVLVDVPLLLSVAARVGKPRLLDNCLLPLALNNRQDATSTLGASSSEA